VTSIGAQVHDAWMLRDMADEYARCLGGRVPCKWGLQDMELLLRQMTDRARAHVKAQPVVDEPHSECNACLEPDRYDDHLCKGGFGGIQPNADKEAPAC